MNYETLKNIGLFAGGVWIGILINVYNKPNNVETLPHQTQQTQQAQQTQQTYQAEFRIIIENNSTKIDTIIKIQDYE